MKIENINYKSISQYIEDLKLDYKNLSEYELLSIAIQQQRNDIFASGLSVSQTDSHPSAIEAIAIQLGYTTKSAY